MSDPRGIEGLEAGDERQQADARCADCVPVPGWPCHTTLRGGGKPIHLGCYIEAKAGYADGKSFDWNDPRNWPASYDMRGYTDAPTVSQGMVRSKERI